MIFNVLHDMKVLGNIGSSIESRLEELDASPRAVFAAMLVLEEVGTNIIKYAYRDIACKPEHSFSLAVTVIDRHLVMRFEDWGVPFDATQEVVIDETSLEESSIGGRGLLLVQRMCHDLRYSRERDGNVLEAEIDLDGL